MIIDSTSIRPSPSKLEDIENMTSPSNVEQIRASLGMTGYLWQFIRNYSITAAPLTDLLRNKEFASKKARNSQSLGEPEKRGPSIRQKKPQLHPQCSRSRTGITP